MKQCSHDAPTDARSIAAKWLSSSASQSEFSEFEGAQVMKRPASAMTGSSGKNLNSSGARAEPFFL